MVTIDEEVTDWILRGNFNNYVKGEQLYNAMSECLGEGIFNIDGEDWKIQRKTASHLFKKKLLRSFLSQYTKHGDKLVSYLKKNLGEWFIKKLLVTQKTGNYLKRFTHKI